MGDLLAREEAPLSSEEWARLDQVVVETARKYLAGRKFIPLYGPLGAGLPAVPAVALTGLEGEGSIGAPSGGLLPLKRLQKDFVLEYEALEMAKRLDLPLDLSAAAVAAHVVATQEDDLIFNGCPENGSPGLLNAKGVQKVEAGSWDTAGALLADVIKAMEALGSAGFPGPYAVVVAPSVWAMAHRPLGGGQMLESMVIESVAKAGFLAAPAMSPKQALVLEVGSQNLDLAVGMDLQVAYLGPDNLNHPFRVMETVALRIKRPQAIVVVG